MYQRLFDWVVLHVNSSVEMEDCGADSIVIGVLDIYGFEIFQINRWGSSEVTPAGVIIGKLSS